MENRQEVRRPQFFEWIAMGAVVALLVLNCFIERGDHPILYTLGTSALLLALVFIFPPFYLLQKHGHPEEGKSYMHTTAVVDRGLYGVVRHPQYLGYLLLVLGFVLRSQHAATATLGGAAIAMLYLQTLREERFCLDRLSGGYADYLRRVPRFNFVLGFIRYLGRRMKRT